MGKESEIAAEEEEEVEEVGAEVEDGEAKVPPISQPGQPALADQPEASPPRTAGTIS